MKSRWQFYIHISTFGVIMSDIILHCMFRIPDIWAYAARYDILAL